MVINGVVNLLNRRIVTLNFMQFEKRTIECNRCNRQNALETKSYLNEHVIHSIKNQWQNVHNRQFAHTIMSLISVRVFFCWNLLRTGAGLCRSLYMTLIIFNSFLFFSFHPHLSKNIMYNFGMKKKSVAHFPN